MQYWKINSFCTFSNHLVSILCSHHAWWKNKPFGSFSIKSVSKLYDIFFQITIWLFYVVCIKKMHNILDYSLSTFHVCSFTKYKSGYGCCQRTCPGKNCFFYKGFDNHGYFRFLKSLVKKRFFKIRTNIKTI